MKGQSMSARKLWFLGIFLLLLQPLNLDGQTIKPADRGPWEAFAFLGGIEDSPEFNPIGGELFLDPDQNPLFGFGVNRHFGVGMFMGVSGRYAPFDMRPPGQGVTDINAYFFSGNIGYTLPLHDRFDIYAQIGGTGASWHPEQGESETNFGFSYGGGVRLYMIESLAVFGDYRRINVPTAMSNLTESIADVVSTETFHGSSFTGGVAYFFGSKDSDGDGVKDKDDACPNTPMNVTVDAQGCPLDSDRDGVADYLDECPDTPAGARVNAQGCPLDSDNDGVFDGLDRCPNTPAGADVDTTGCPLDSDGDGVFDGLDRCPNTPAGTAVDEVGCPLPTPEPMVFNLDADVHFEFDSAELTTEGQRALYVIGDSLAAHTDLSTVEVEGHTDSVGNDEYNMNLSLRRAESVRSFLLENYAGLSRIEFSVRGFGETRPVADNSTEEGQALNRRVEIRVGR